MRLEIRVTDCPNFFDRRTVSRRRISWEPETTLADIHPIEWESLRRCHATINGTRHEVETWDKVNVPPSSYVHFVCVPQGIEIAIGIGLTGVAALAAGFIINIGIAVGLSLLANKFIGPPEETDFGSSPTYDWGNLQMTTRNGQPIPVVYGEHRVAGHVLSARPVKAEDGSTVLKMVVGYGEGPIHSIAGMDSDQNNLRGSNIPAGIRINQNEANELEGIRIWTRLGTLTQQAIPGFEDNVSTTDVGQVLELNAPITVTTSLALESFELFVFFPQGLYYRKKSSGKIKTECVSYTLRWRRTGETDWTEEIDATICEAKTQPFTITIRNDNPGITYSGPVKVDIQLEKTTDVGDYRHFDAMTWISVSEITPGRASHFPHTVVVALEIPAQQEANNTIPTVTIPVQGKLVWQWDPSDLDPLTSVLSFGYSANPAHCLMDWMLNERYGGGDVFKLCDMDLQSLDDWRQYCDETVDDLSGTSTTMTRWEIALVVDTDKGFWDVCNTIAMTGRASLILSGRIVKIKIERAADPIQLFSDGNINMETLAIQYVSNLDRPNILESEFLDEDLEYEHGFASLEDPIRLLPTTTPNTGAVAMFGIAKKARVYRALQFLLNVNRLITRSIQFECGVEACLVEPGDVFAFQHNIPKWDGDKAFGGRFLADATASTVTLDLDLTIGAGEEYRCYFKTSGAGADQVRNRLIVNSPGTYTAGTALTVNTTISTDVPVRGDVYAVIETTQKADIQLFRVLEIEVAQEMDVRISGMEYNENVYLDTPNIKVPTGADDNIDRSTIPPNPLFLSLVITGSDDLLLTIGWEPAAWPFLFAHRVGLRDDTEGDAEFVEINRTDRGVNFFEIDDPEIGHTYTISVAPCSADGTACRQFADGKIAAILVVGAAEFPDPITGLTCVQSGSMVTVSWDGIDEDDNDLASYEVRRGASWVNGRLITRTIDTSIQTALWALGDETFMVRARSNPGEYSETTPHCDVTLINKPGESTDTSIDEVSGGFAATKTNVTVNSDGELELSSSQTSGTYERTGITPSGGAGPYTVHLNFHSLQDDLGETWESSSTTWDDSTGTWDAATGTWSAGDLIWESAEAKQRSWEGIIATATDTTATLEIKPDGSGSYIPYVPGVFNFTTLDYRLTLTRANATNFQVRVTQALVTLSQ